jgi:amino acid transporter
MSAQKRAPKVFSEVSEKTRTPWVATLCVSLAAAIFAIWLPLEHLAKTTSFIILCVFTLVNLSLWRVKDRYATELAELPVATPCFPITGALLCIGLLVFQLINSILQ